MTLQVDNEGPLLQAKGYNADVLRQLFQIGLLGAGLVQQAALPAIAGGVLGPYDFMVLQSGSTPSTPTSGTPGLNVNVWAGQAAIPGTAASSQQGAYHAYNDSVTVSLAVAAGPAAPNSRNDLVILGVKDGGYGGGAGWTGTTNRPQLQVVQGTPGNPGVDPSLSSFNDYIVLARIVVPSGASSITASMITDLRPRLRRTGAGVVMAGSQGDTGSADALLQLNTPEWDSVGQFYGATPAYNVSTGAFTCPVAGIYEIAVSVITAVYTTGDRLVKLYKNGVSVREVDRKTAQVTGGNLRLSGSTKIVCNAGDVLSLYANTPGTTANAVSGGYASYTLWSL